MGVKFIPLPILGIIDNIITNALTGLFITNEVFIIIALPKFRHHFARIIFDSVYAGLILLDYLIFRVQISPFSNSSRRPYRHRNVIPHSVRNDFTGFASAAFIDCTLIVKMAIKRTEPPAIINVHPFILMR